MVWMSGLRFSSSFSFSLSGSVVLDVVVGVGRREALKVFRRSC